MSLPWTESVVFFGYFLVLLLVTLFSYRKHLSSKSFVLGDRSLNFWLTALSAQASDMGGWLFLGYPALIFGQGLFAAWAAIGLVLGMFCNWHFVAPRLRRITEQYGNLTLNGFFESRVGDCSGLLRSLSALLSIFFFTVYIGSGLIAMGLLVQSLFGISYSIGILIGLAVVLAYVLTGGYCTVAWVDLFQGLFLLVVIVWVPILLLRQLGGEVSLMDRVSLQGLTTSLLPHSLGGFWTLLMTAVGWGLGYFGQPHILTKFMGIRDPNELGKAKYVGTSWMVIALLAATAMGLCGIAFFPAGLSDAQQVGLLIVKTTLSPLLVALASCAILAATTNVMAAHILIVASNLSEDLYQRLLRPRASERERIWISRSSVLVIGGVGLLIAFAQPSSIYQLVLYAWSGLGATFGPLVFACLYFKHLHRWGACAGVFAGGILSAIWPSVESSLQMGIPPILPGFLVGLLAIHLVSKWMRRTDTSEVEQIVNL